MKAESTTRARLLEAAIRCIEEKGYGATTARDISTMSGANLASIGYHFGGKDALLDEALLVASDRWIDPIVRVRDGHTLRERIANGLAMFVGSLPDNRGTIVAFFEAMSRMERSAPLRARLAEAYDRLRGAAVAGILAGSQLSLSAAERDALASAVIALYDGVLLQWMLDPDRSVDVDAMVDTLGAALSRGA